MPNKVASTIVTAAHKTPRYHGGTENYRHNILAGVRECTVSPQRTKLVDVTKFSGPLICRRGGVQPWNSLPTPVSGLTSLTAGL